MVKLCSIDMILCSINVMVYIVFVNWTNEEVWTQKYWRMCVSEWLQNCDNVYASSKPTDIKENVEFMS